MVITSVLFDPANIVNDNGLTEQETDFFESLEKEKVSALVQHLKDNGFAEDHIGTYLKFVDVPHLQDSL